MLAAGAEAPQSEPAPQSLPWEPGRQSGSDPEVAETMIQGLSREMSSDASADAGEATTLMPVWQPPAMPAEGAAQPTAGDKAEPLVSGSGRQAELTIETGPDAGHSHRAGDNALRLGRSPDNDIILRDPATSGHHARVERRGDQFWIVDLGSTNGTLVNGEPIQEKELNHGDRVTIGQNSVQFSFIGS
jgi:hypothetical protein